MALYPQIFRRGYFVLLSLLAFVFVSSEVSTAQPPVLNGVRNVVKPVLSAPSSMSQGVRGERYRPRSGRGFNVSTPTSDSIPGQDFVDSFALYGVGVRNISWNSRTDGTVSALAFYPTTPPASGQKFSVVIYSHGLGGAPENFSYLGYSWAGRGVVSIFLRHPGSDESIWRGKIRAMGELKEAYQKYWNSRDRARLIRSAIDFLYRSHGEEGPLGRDLDLSHVCVAGNDLGALAALLVAGQLPPDNGSSLKDSRVSAVLALSPTVFCDEAQASFVYSGIEVPTMIVTGTDDNGIVGTTKAYQRRIPYDNISLVDRYLVVLQGGDHRVYGGHRRAQKQNADRPYQDTIRRETTDFLAAYLQGDANIYNALRTHGRTTGFANASVEWKACAPIAIASSGTVTTVIKAAPQTDEVEVKEEPSELPVEFTFEERSEPIEEATVEIEPEETVEEGIIELETTDDTIPIE